MYKSVLQRPCEDTLHEDGRGGGGPRWDAFIHIITTYDTLPWLIIQTVLITR